MKNTGRAIPEWFGLLRYQRECGNTGFTIPFMIGATCTTTWSLELTEHESELSNATMSLLTEFRDLTPTTHWLEISECDKLHVPVVAVYPPGDRRERRIGLADRTGAKRLYADRRYFHGKKLSIVSLHKRLWALVREALLDSAYSYDDGRYGPFSDADQNLIEDVRRWWKSKCHKPHGHV
jgi:hypothetical protein